MGEGVSAFQVVKGGVSFFDYCKSSTKCPFSAVIFASDLDKFGDVSKYERSLEVTGVIKSYQGKATHPGRFFYSLLPQIQIFSTLPMKVFS